MKGARARYAVGSRHGAAPRGSRSRWGGLAGAFLAGAALLAGGGCSENLPAEPEATATNVIVAYYQSPEEFEQGIIDLDGERIDREWGSRFTPERPFYQIRLSAEEGAGDPGTPAYASLKAVYTDEDLYLLIQWVDSRADALKDVFVYDGPDLSAPLVTCGEVGGEIVCDSLYRRGCLDSLLVPQWWHQAGEDDKLALAFEILPTSSSEGSFAEIGCQVACHGLDGGSFGTLDEGRLDLWFWLAGRTNPIRNIFNPYDDPDDPRQGTPGYLDDFYVDQLGGLTPDPGTAGYIPNFIPGTGLPRYVYRLLDDDFFEPPDPNACLNRFGEHCRQNNGLSLNYIWRENPRAGVAPFAACDTLNQTISPDPRKWRPGDIVPGYLFTYPSGSRADVRGKGNFNEDEHTWTLEVGRKLDTGNPLQDVIFDPDSGAQYVFTMAIFDASRHVHWGSAPQVLVFGPKAER